MKARAVPRSRRSAAASAVPSRLLELDRDECLRLLASARLGRLAVNAPDWAPVIRPVNYVFDPSSQSVVFRTARGSKFTALVLSGQAAFEIDGADPAEETGWSVIVIGVAEEVTSVAEVARIEQLGLRPWAPGEKPHVLRIRTTVVSGRRIAA
jgi:nitroimidazol reductase NimA-like FMN-containing flavoprotein (pyridoxamine 5'-phosphate oxidase superfamily)